MRSILATLLILFFAAVFVRADSPAVQTLQVQVSDLIQDMAQMSARLKLTAYEAQVRQAQAVYNFHLDRLFDISCLNFSVPANAARLQDHLDLLMESFCPDFGTWTAAGPGVANGSVTQIVNVPPSAIGFAATRATYQGITAGGVFGCGSQHNVINPVVTFSSDSHGRTVGTLTARLWQFALFGATNTWADIMGWYDNDWTLENGQWCMSRFFAANDIIVTRTPGDVNIYAFAQGTDQLPPLPRAVPDYIA